MSFRENLQSLRAQRNMTQEQLAMLLGVSRQSVTKWEAERSYPEMDKLIRMCDIFECSLDDLVKGDLTGRESAAPSVVMPAGKPVDVCGYDEHQRMLAWKIPTGIAAILFGVGLMFLVQGAPFLSEAVTDSLCMLCVLAGVLAGLACFIPAGMAHSAFVKAHPFIEDFYTEEDKAESRRQFSKGFLVGIGSIFVGVFCMMLLEPEMESVGLFLLMACIGVGVWFIVRYWSLYDRTNVARYNKSVADDLEMEDIVNAQIEESLRSALVANKRRNRKRDAVCGSIMIVSTIVGLALLLIPILSAPDPGNFEAAGTSVTWFWMAWVVGGLLCVIVSLVWDGFSKES